MYFLFLLGILYFMCVELVTEVKS